MGRPLTPAQEKIRDAQLSKNEEYITNIDLLLGELEPFITESNKYNNYLVDLFEKLNNAHGMLMQGKYANLYTKHFGKPASRVIDFYDNISDEFFFLDEQNKQRFLSELPDPAEYQVQLDSYFSKIKPLFEDVSAENSIIVRFEGMEQLCMELKKLSDQHWSYPQEMALRQALHNREFLQPLTLHGVPRAYPFHVEVYLEYSPKLNTGLLIKGKLQKLRSLLKTINAQLPFAELNEKVPHIQNIVNGIDKSTTVGNNTSIGDNNAIGDNASVEGD
ncbi:hypothetical protein ACFCP7_27465 [Paenibacillus elgii]